MSRRHTFSTLFSDVVEKNESRTKSHYITYILNIELRLEHSLRTERVEVCATKWLIYKSKMLGNQTDNRSLVSLCGIVLHWTQLSFWSSICLRVVSVPRIISRRRVHGVSFVLNLFKRTPLSRMIQPAANYKTRRARSSDCKTLKTDSLTP